MDYNAPWDFLFLSNWLPHCVAVDDKLLIVTLHSHFQSLGQVGRVIKVQANGDVRVAVNGRRWVLNPHCMVPAPKQVPQEDISGKRKKFGV